MPLARRVPGMIYRVRFEQMVLFWRITNACITRHPEPKLKAPDAAINRPRTLTSEYEASRTSEAKMYEYAILRFQKGLMSPDSQYHSRHRRQGTARSADAEDVSHLEHT
jgi:hypothetical protein